jgi:predicted  nucleic acid-binding Zn-ribbon protein
LLLRLATLIALCVSFPNGGSAQSNAGGALIDRVADRIARAALIRDAAMAAGEPAIDAHARHDDEPLAVSVARAVVFSVRDRRGQGGYDAALKSAAEFANPHVKLGLGMLADGGTFLANIVEAASSRQELINLGDEAGELELKLNQQFDAADVRDVKTVMGFLRSADEAAFVKARRAVRTQLERTAGLLEPFAKEAPPTAALLASRQRVSAMLAR